MRMKNNKSNLTLLSLVVLSMTLTGCFWKKKKSEKKISHSQHSKHAKKGSKFFNENVEAFVLAEDDKVTPSSFGRSSKNIGTQAFAEDKDGFAPVHFNFDDYSIRQDQEPIVDFDAQHAKQAYKEGKQIKVAGHSDKWCKSELYNDAVAQKRAAVGKQRLIQAGIDSKSVKAIGYGDSQPVVDTPAKEERNRRIEFAVIG